MDGYSSRLFAELNTVAPTATWQREFARALQTWAEYSNLNFRFVGDDSSPQGTMGLCQGNSQFGDIRLGTTVLASNVLGYTHYPDTETTSYTDGGDLALNSNHAYAIGSSPDLYSIALHELGHALGLMHSSAGTVMYGAYTTVLTGLTSDDIAGIQAMYGARRPDAYDTASGNNGLGTATTLTLASGAAAVRADLTTRADVDYFRVVASGSSLTASVDARNLSLLAPKVLVYDAAGNLLGSATADYGQTATLNLTGLTAGQTYYLVADGATADVFGVGAYGLSAQFGGGSTVTAPQAPSGLSAVATASTQVSLSWQDNSGNEDGFRVERSTDGVTFTLAGTAGANATSYSVTGLAAGTTNYFRVRAYNAGGDSAWSNTAQATTQTTTPTAPLAPSGTVATAVTSSQVDVTWQDNSGNEDGFRVERSTDGVTFTLAGTAGANATSYSVTGLAAGTTNYFRVRAYNAGGDSAWSNTAQATTPPAPPPTETSSSLTADRYESNDTAATAKDLGKFNSTSQTALTIHSATDVDWFTFTVNSNATFQVTITFPLTSGNLDLYVYNTQQQMMAAGTSVTANDAVTINFSGGKLYYVKVVSPDGGLNTYDLTITKLGGKGGRGGSGGYLVLGDPLTDTTATQDGTPSIPLGGCGCPACTGAASTSSVTDDGTGTQTSRPTRPVRSFDSPGYSWSKALLQLSDLDLPFRDRLADPTGVAWNPV